MSTDCLHLTARKMSLNSGDDMAGTIYGLGENVNEFEIGDRVAAFHPMFTRGGTYAEYALAPRHTVFEIPDGMSFEGTSTVFVITSLIDIEQLLAFDIRITDI